jgi:hypothetical protein
MGMDTKEQEEIQVQYPQSSFIYIIQTNKQGSIYAMWYFILRIGLLVWRKRGLERRGEYLVNKLADLATIYF